MLLTLLIYDALSHSFNEAPLRFQREPLLFKASCAVSDRYCALLQCFSDSGPDIGLHSSTGQSYFQNDNCAPTTTPLSITIHVRHYNLLGSFASLKSFPLCGVSVLLWSHSFLSLGREMLTQCHCMLEVCKLYFHFCRGSQCTDYPESQSKP